MADATISVWLPCRSEKSPAGHLCGKRAVLLLAVCKPVKNFSDAAFHAGLQRHQTFVSFTSTLKNIAGTLHIRLYTRCFRRLREFFSEFFPVCAGSDLLPMPGRGAEAFV